MHFISPPHYTCMDTFVRILPKTRRQQHDPEFLSVRPRLYSAPTEQDPPLCKGDYSDSFPPPPRSSRNRCFFLSSPQIFIQSGNEVQIPMKFHSIDPDPVEVPHFPFRLNRDTLSPDSIDDEPGDLESFFLPSDSPTLLSFF